jgi:hypothetical protein
MPKQNGKRKNHSVPKNKKANEEIVKKFLKELIRYIKNQNIINFQSKNKKKLNYEPSVTDIIENNSKLNQYYGPEIYAYSLSLDRNFPYDFVRKHSFNSIMRITMIDWMLHIFNSYNSEPSSFFSAVHYFDTYIKNSRYNIYDEDIHLIGISCIFIASKMEDIIPLHLNQVTEKIAHNKFKPRTISNKEREILTTINWDLVIVNTYNFIRTYIYDFYINNIKIFEKSNIKNYIKKLEYISIYLARMVCLEEKFCIFPYSLKAVCIIVAAFDILCANSKNISEESEFILKKWILCLLKSSSYSINIIRELYHKIIYSYQNLYKLNEIAPALNHIYKLEFD